MINKEKYERRLDDIQEKFLRSNKKAIYGSIALGILGLSTIVAGGILGTNHQSNRTDQINVERTNVKNDSRGKLPYFVAFLGIGIVGYGQIYGMRTSQKNYEEKIIQLSELEKMATPLV